MSELRLLVVDDSIDDFELAQFVFQRAGHTVVARRVDTPIELEVAITEPWHFCLIDWVMPCLTAPEVIRALQASVHPPPPCIIWSGRRDEKVAWAAVEILNARAFLHKDDYNALPALLAAALGTT